MIKLFQMIIGATESTAPSGDLINFLLASTWATVNSDPWGYPAAYTIDEDLSTFWHTDSGTFPNWIEFDLGAGNEKAAGDIILATRDSGDQHYWKDFKLQGSSSGTPWTDIFVIEDYDRYANGVPQFFPNSDITTYRYFRFYITQTSSTYCCMGEVMLFENETPGGAGLDSYTTSLMHFNKPYNFYTWQLLRDEASYTAATFNNLPLWFASAANVATFDTTIKKFGNSSLYLDGTQDAPFYLWPYGTFDGFTVATGNFCIEIQVAVQELLAHDQYIFSAAGLGYLCYTSAGTVVANLEISTDPWNLTLTSSVALSADSEFNHIAVVRYGDNLFLYIQGASVATKDCTGKSVGPYWGTPWFGGSGGASSSMKGWLDEWRFSKGTARYTGEFTPPTEEF